MYDIIFLEDNMEIQIQHLTKVPILCPTKWTSRNSAQEETQTSMQRLI